VHAMQPAASAAINVVVFMSASLLVPSYINAARHGGRKPAGGMPKS
jgi:hypothetical protein